MINGFEYASEDVQIILPGKATPVAGALKIQYDYEKEHVNIKGMSSKTVALGRGTEETSGSLTILQSELEGWIASLPPGQNLVHQSPFTVTVAYAPPGAIAVVDQLLYCRVKKFTKVMNAGDTHMKVDIELAVGDIKYNV